MTVFIDIAITSVDYTLIVLTYLEVLEADRTLFSAAIELSELRQQYIAGYVKLFKALGGGGWPAGKWTRPAMGADPETDRHQ